MLSCPAPSAVSSVSSVWRGRRGGGEEEERGTGYTVPQPSSQPGSRMSRHQQQQQQQLQQQHRTTLRLTDNVVEVKSKFEAEYRRFALKRNGPGGFTEFYRLLQTIHRIPGVDVLLGYADVQGDLLPINNDDNFYKAVSLANPLLRIIITKRVRQYTTNLTISSLQTQRRKKGLGLTGLRSSGFDSTRSKNKPGLMIGLPQNFRQISSIIDVDILPETHRRVRLHKHGTHKPLGFYIRDGVTDMMVANSHNLIVTVKPANQKNNVVHRGSRTSMGNSGSVGSAGSAGSALSHDSPSPASQSNPITASNSIAEGDSDDDDDEGDLILENDSLTLYDSSRVTNSNNTNLNRDSPSNRPLPQSVSLPNSVGASLSDSSVLMSNHNGNPAHTSSSSQESMREDGNIITL
ncbi:hypothetical protein F7725_022223 [Dissostichus mawsoni]|uniref:PB1 domain-containing protein n=1 Tax=Dissostichus mawsoni TaxID=36200 RepID=A0A7J5Z1I0_DISMA|nr:hypothetical protein F7725_022223 [Dissostichus mawsoni]